MRRLKIQQRLKEGELGVAESMEQMYNKQYPSALPLLPPMVRLCPSARSVEFVYDESW